MTTCQVEESCICKQRKQNMERCYFWCHWEITGKEPMCSGRDKAILIFSIRKDKTMISFNPCCQTCFHKIDCEWYNRIVRGSRKGETNGCGRQQKWEKSKEHFHLVFWMRSYISIYVAEVCVLLKNALQWPSSGCNNNSRKTQLCWLTPETNSELLLSDKSYSLSGFLLALFSDCC